MSSINEYYAKADMEYREERAHGRDTTWARTEGRRGAFWQRGTWKRNRPDRAHGESDR